MAPYPILLTAFVIVSANAAASYSYLTQSSSRETQSLSGGTQTQAPTIEINIKSKQKEVSADFTAGKIIVNRKEIENSGAQNAQELLKKHPSIVITSNGRISLMGLPGYTQILIDGLPSASGKSPLELDLVHVERIEIIKSSVAEYGPYGIAGTINIISRKISVRKSAQSSIGVTYSEGGTNANFSWSNSILDASSPIGINNQLSTSVGTKTDQSKTTIFQRQSNTNAIETLKNIIKSRTSTETKQINGSTNFIFKLAPDNRIEIDPSLLFINLSKLSKQHTQLDPEDSNIKEIQDSSNTPFITLSIPVSWNAQNESGDRFKIRVSPTIYRLNGVSRTREIQENERVITRNSSKIVENRINIFKFDYNPKIDDFHDLKFGFTFNSNSGNSDYTYRTNGNIDHSLSMYGEHNNFSDIKRVYFAQHDLRYSDHFATNIGLTGEIRSINSNEGGFKNRSRYSIFAPSMHFAWKPDSNTKRQIRLSIARTFNAPFLDQLVQRPIINSLSPCDAAHYCKPNTFTTADNMGNPLLKPEKSDGFNLSYDYSLGEESQLALNLYGRKINDLFIHDIRQQAVPWSNSPRYVIRPINEGSAWLSGIGVESQLQLSELIHYNLKTTIYGGLNFSTSKRSAVSGANNHIIDHTPWTIKLGGTHTFTTLPIKVGIDLNSTPNILLRISEKQLKFTNKTLSVNLNANWISKDFRVRFSLDNLLPKNIYVVDEFVNSQGTDVRKMYKKTYFRFGLRLEIKQ